MSISTLACLATDASELLPSVSCSLLCQVWSSKNPTQALLVKIQHLETMMLQRDEALEAERKERGIVLEVEHAERKKLEETTRVLQDMWVTEKEERVEQYGEVVERTTDLEWCLTHKVHFSATTLCQLLLIGDPGPGPPLT